MLLYNSRYVTQLDAMMNARQAARAAMHTVAVELRMISTGGLTAADPKSVTARIPYAWGMTCNMDLGDRIASLVPTDSMMFASATAGGIGYRGTAWNYTFLTGITVAPSTATQACDDADSRPSPRSPPSRAARKALRATSRSHRSWPECRGCP